MRTFIRAMPRLTRALLAGSCATLLGACAHSPWLTFGFYSGYYQQAAELSRFVPAGTHENWWLIGSIPCRPVERPGTVDTAALVHVVVKGSLSPEGEYGPQGVFVRRLEVHEVISCRPLLPNERPDF